METNWQSNLKSNRDRIQYLLQSEKLVDCQFLVGTSPNQRLISGHRLILAMASTVFEAMFYGSLPEKDNPILIPDVHSDAFKAMLDYIYTDRLQRVSFYKACHLCYVAKKYMLPHLVKHCIYYILTYLRPTNACHAYEFAKFVEEKHLMERSMKVIVTNTREVIADPSFLDIEVSTLIDILDQNRLNIDSELELFNCLSKFANERGLLIGGDNDNKTVADSENPNDVVEVFEDLSLAAASTTAGNCGSVPNVADEVVVIDSDASDSGNASESTADKAMLRQAVKKIRFLKMTPQQFAEGPARSKLLQKKEALAILIKILSPFDSPMPEGFCQSSERNVLCFVRANIFSNNRHYYSSSKYSRLNFKVNTNTYLLSVQIVVLKPELRPERRLDVTGLSACIQNMHGSDIACHSTVEEINNLTFEFTFNSPVFINCDQEYTIKINNDNCHSLSLMLSSWERKIGCNGVKFSILEAHPINNILSSPISSIIFST